MINSIASDGVVKIAVSKIFVSCPKHGSSRGVWRPGREAYHSPPTSAEVNNEWRYISPPPIRPQGAEILRRDIYLCVAILRVVIVAWIS